MKGISNIEQRMLNFEYNNAITMYNVQIDKYNNAITP